MTTKSLTDREVKEASQVLAEIINRNSDLVISQTLTEHEELIESDRKVRVSQLQKLLDIAPRTNIEEVIAYARLLSELYGAYDDYADDEAALFHLRGLVDRT